MSDQIRLKCTSCNSTIKATSKHQGKKVNCRKCGHLLKNPLKSASVNPTGPQTKTPSSIAKIRQPSQEVVVLLVPVDSVEGVTQVPVGGVEQPHRGFSHTARRRPELR